MFLIHFSLNAPYYPTTSNLWSLCPFDCHPFFPLLLLPVLCSKSPSIPSPAVPQRLREPIDLVNLSDFYCYSFFFFFLFMKWVLIVRIMLITFIILSRKYCLKVFAITHCRTVKGGINECNNYKYDFQVHLFRCMKQTVTVEHSWIDACAVFVKVTSESLVIVISF